MPMTSRLQNELPFPGDAVPKYKYLFVPCQAMTGWAAALVGAGAGDPIIGENTTSSLTGLRIQANADSMATLLALPDDVDVEAPIDLAIVWSSDQASADTYTWTILFSDVTLNGTSGLDTAGATALNTVLVQDTGIATASIAQRTEWGTINGGVIGGTIEDDHLVNVLMTATTNGGTVSTDLVIWYGLMVRYMPKSI